MGSWDISCAISGTFINEAAECMVIPLVKKPWHSEGTSYYQAIEIYSPCGFPIKGDYDTYGGIDTVEDDINHKLNTLFYGQDYENKFGDLSLTTSLKTTVNTMFVDRNIFKFLIEQASQNAEYEGFSKDKERSKKGLEKAYEEYWMWQKIANKHSEDLEIADLAREPRFYSFDGHCSVDQALSGLAKYEFLDEEFCTFLKEYAIKLVKEKKMKELLEIIDPLSDLYYLNYAMKFIVNRPFTQNVGSTQYPENYLLEKQNKFFQLCIDKNNVMIKEQEDFDKEQEEND